MAKQIIRKVKKTPNTENRPQKVNLEIEKKYLVLNSDWKNFVISSFAIVQGYLSSDPERCVRVRIFGDNAFITIKGKKLFDSLVK